MSHEEVTPCADKRIPKGFAITYHELRGYDSPDRWYEAHRGRTKLGDFGNFQDALTACKARARAKARGR